MSANASLITARAAGELADLRQSSDEHSLVSARRVEINAAISAVNAGIVVMQCIELGPELMAVKDADQKLVITAKNHLEAARKQVETTEKEVSRVEAQGAKPITANSSERIDVRQLSTTSAVTAAAVALQSSAEVLVYAAEETGPVAPESATPAEKGRLAVAAAWFAMETAWQMESASSATELASSAIEEAELQLQDTEVDPPPLSATTQLSRLEQDAVKAPEQVLLTDTVLGRLSTLVYVTWLKRRQGEIRGIRHYRPPALRGYAFKLEEFKDEEKQERNVDLALLVVLRQWLRQQIFWRTVSKVARALAMPLFFALWLTAIMAMLRFLTDFESLSAGETFWSTTWSQSESFIWTGSIWVAAALAVGQIARFIIGWVTDRSTTDLDDVLGTLFQVVITVTVLVMGVGKARAELPVNLKSLVKEIGRTLNEDKLLLAFVIVLVTAIAVVVFNRVIVVVLERTSRKTSQKFDDGFAVLLRIYGAFSISVVGGGVLIFALRDVFGNESGIDHVLIPYAILVGAVTALIGFVTQESTTNFVSGMMMQIDRPFEADEWVRLETGEVCQVREVGVRATRLIDVFENTEISVPNSMMASGKIVNIARPNDQLRLTIPLSVRPQDFAKADAILRIIAHAHQEIVVAVNETMSREIAKLQGVFPQRFDELAAALDSYRTAMDPVPTVNADAGSNPPTREAVLKCECEAGEWFSKIQHDDPKALATIREAKSAFDHLSRAFYRSFPDGDEIRFHPASRNIAQELATEPTVHSDYVLAEDGVSIVKISLRVYARLFERREEVAHSINMEIARRFGENDIKILDARYLPVLDSRPSAGGKGEPGVAGSRPTGTGLRGRLRTRIH
ncbi:MAG: mechanosensitive ion channel domain-containing protein [Acidimicrobiales bacterium]